MDTIAAVSTPPGVGGIAIVRISGSNTFQILKKIFVGKDLNRAKPNTIHHGFIKDPETNETIDEVLVSVFKTPNSYTGEDVAEISCHGGRLVPNLILEAVIRAGARLAKPGEFTERAFLNGKIDLIQAQAVLDLIHAKSRKAVHYAINRLTGKLSEKIKSIGNNLLDLIVQIEARIDFEEDVPPLDSHWLEQQILKIYNEIRDIVNTGKKGRYYFSGIHVAIMGPPNVGKSTLFNRLLGKDRAIVTEIPGTTRDVISEELVLNGVPIVLYDTAGIRETKDIVESMGVDRALQKIKEVDIVIEMTEPQVVQSTHSEISDVIKIKVLNKIDLLRDKTNMPKNILPISALTGEGVEALKAKLLTEIKGLVYGADISLSDREVHLLESVIKDLEDAESTLKTMGLEIVAFHLRSAYQRFQELIGYSDMPELILSQIFKNFCVGK